MPHPTAHWQTRANIDLLSDTVGNSTNDSLLPLAISIIRCSMFYSKPGFNESNFIFDNQQSPSETAMFSCTQKIDMGLSILVWLPLLVKVVVLLDVRQLSSDIEGSWLGLAQGCFIPLS